MINDLKNSMLNSGPDMALSRCVVLGRSYIPFWYLAFLCAESSLLGVIAEVLGGSDCLCFCNCYFNEGEK
jgi:hypothetical protein